MSLGRGGGGGGGVGDSPICTPPPPSPDLSLYIAMNNGLSAGLFVGYALLGSLRS